MSKSYLWHFLKITFTVALISACIYFLEFEVVLESLMELNPIVYLLAFLTTFFGTIFLPAVVTRIALSVSNMKFDLLKLVSINLSVRFYILILPRAAAMGIRWLRYRKNGSGYEAAALIMFERVVQTMVVAVMGTIFIVVDLDVLQKNGYFLLAILLGLSAFLTLLFLMFLSERMSFFLDYFQAGKRTYIPVFFKDKLIKITSSIKDFRNVRRSDAIQILLVSLLAYILFILSAWIVLKGMNLDIGLHTLIWIRSVVFLLTLIPISVGGIGVRDITIIYYLTFFGISEESAFSFSLALLAVQLLLGLWGGIIEAYHLTSKFKT